MRKLLSLLTQLATRWLGTELTLAREITLIASGFSIAALAATYPLIMHLGSVLPNDLGDPVLNAWILAWDADRLLHGLNGLWTAPMYFPYEATLAYSENLLGIAIFTAPLQWLTGNPVLVYNVAFLASFVLAGTGMYLLATSITGSRAAGLVAGIAFAFLPYRADKIPHLQVLMYGWMPVALWGFHRYFSTGHRLALTVFAVAFLLQGLSNGYFFYFFSAAVIVVGVVELLTRVWTRPRMIVELAATAFLMLVSLIPVAIPYLNVGANQALTRSRSENIMFSADALAYFHASPNLVLWRDILPQGAPEASLFPGFALLTMAVIGLLGSFTKWPNTRHPYATARVAVSYFLIVLIGFVLSLGPEPTYAGRLLTESGPYDWLYNIVPGLDGLRVPARAAILVFLGLTVLAAIGVERLRTLCSPRTAGVGCFILAAVFIAEGYYQAKLIPFPQTPIPSEQASYDWLEQQPPGGTIILPIRPRDPIVNTLRYVYSTLQHRQPLVNGYSGYGTSLIRSIETHERDVSAYGDLLRGLRALQVRYLVLHEHRYEDQAWMQQTDGPLISAAIRAQSDQWVAHHRFGTSDVFELAPSTESIDILTDDLIPIDLSELRQTTGHRGQSLEAMWDNDYETRWSSDAPQAGHEWIEWAFDKPTNIGHVRFSLAKSLNDYPRNLLIEGSFDGETYRTLYEDRGLPKFFLGLVDDPEHVPIDIALPQNESLKLRLRQRGVSSTWYWSIHEMRLWER
jgi:hypothetical protein